MPARVDARNLIRILRDDYDTVVGSGQGRLEGQIARVGHMGFVTLQDIVAFFGALEPALKDLNQPVEPGQSISAVLRAYAETAAPSTRPARGAGRREAGDAVAARR
jgi:aspartate aminotransferase-like enzyme